MILIWWEYLRSYSEYHIFHNMNGIQIIDTRRFREILELVRLIKPLHGVIQVGKYYTV